MYLVQSHSLANNHTQEYDKERIKGKSGKPNQRTAAGRILIGNDCEYIKLNSVAANDGCTNGECIDIYADATFNDDNLREQVCNTAKAICEEAVPHPQWPGHTWVCEEGEEVF